jgi:hypothetical protein
MGFKVYREVKSQVVLSLCDCYTHFYNLLHSDYVRVLCHQL